jgi:hypothetical protein
MRLYLTTSQIPELANLSKKQRCFVKSQCFFWLYHRLPYRVGSLAITIGCILLAAYTADTQKWGIWKSWALAGVSVLVLGYVYDLIWIAYWRPEIARFVQEHATEIETAA